MAHVFNHVAGELGMDPTEVALRNDGTEGKEMAHLTSLRRTTDFLPGIA